jgi:hypothetical protein
VFLGAKAGHCVPSRAQIGEGRRRSGQLGYITRCVDLSAAAVCCIHTWACLNGVAQIGGQTGQGLGQTAQLALNI